MQGHATSRTARLAGCSRPRGGGLLVSRPPRRRGHRRHHRPPGTDACTNAAIAGDLASRRRMRDRRVPDQPAAGQPWPAGAAREPPARPLGPGLDQHAWSPPATSRHGIEFRRPDQRRRLQLARRRREHRHRLRHAARRRQRLDGEHRTTAQNILDPAFTRRRHRASAAPGQRLRAAGRRPGPRTSAADDGRAPRRTTGAPPQRLPVLELAAGLAPAARRRSTGNGVSRRYHSASSAAWQPDPAAVIAWR